MARAEKYGENKIYPHSNIFNSWVDNLMEDRWGRIIIMYTKFHNSLLPFNKVL